ncbi:MAG: sigma-70 family RNA polymerase sigma factor [Planctomycetes bacterium]|nr:sigma-70 family RNA polymerase sigma factor [Planctomycetota bacterium]
MELLPLIREVLRACRAKADDVDDIAQDVAMRLWKASERLAAADDGRKFAAQAARNAFLSECTAAKSRQVRLVITDIEGHAAKRREVGPVVDCDYVIARLAVREQEVWRKWRETGAVKTTARSLRLDVRQVKRSLEKVASALLITGFSSPS